MLQYDYTWVSSSKKRLDSLALFSYSVVSDVSPHIWADLASVESF